MMNFSRWWPKAFLQWGQQWVKFTNSKRTYTFFNFPNPRVLRLSCPLSTPMQTRIIMYIYEKPCSSRNKSTRLLYKLGLCNRNPDFRLRLHLHHVIVLGLGFSCNHSKLLGLGFRLHRPFMCFIQFCHCATLQSDVAQQFLCDVLLSRFFVRWCFVAELFYLIIAG